MKPCVSLRFNWPIFSFRSEVEETKASVWVICVDSFCKMLSNFLPDSDWNSSLPTEIW